MTTAVLAELRSTRRDLEQVRSAVASVRQAVAQMTLSATPQRVLTRH